MVPPLPFGLLLLGRKELGVNSPLRLGLRLPSPYEFLSGSFGKFICPLLMMRLRVIPLDNGNVKARHDRSRHSVQLSTIFAEDATLAY